MEYITRRMLKQLCGLQLPIPTKFQ